MRQTISAVAALIGFAIAGSAPAMACGYTPCGAPAYAYPPAYYPVQGYAPYAYGAAAPVGCPGGYWARRPLVDAYGNVVGYSRPRFFCPVS